jgi:HAMP domain-containing protein
VVAKTARPKPKSLISRGSLARRMVLVILPLVLIPVLLMGTIAYLRSRALLKQQASDQLISTAQAQIQNLQEWTSIREQRLQLAAQRASLKNLLSELTGYDEFDPGYEAAKESIRFELESLRIREGQFLFSDILVASTVDDSVIVSTNPELEGGQLPMLADQRLSLQTLESRPLYDDPSFAPGNLAFITSVPMRISIESQTADRVLIGVNAGARLGELMEYLQIFWEQRGAYRIERGQTYIAMAPDVIFSMPQYATAPAAQAEQQHPVFSKAESDLSSTVEYANVDDEPVLAAYEWVPEWNLGIVVELPQSDVFAEVISLAPFTAVLVVVAGVLTIIVVTFVTTRMLRPLVSLTEFAGRMSRGDWSYRVPEEGDDEVSTLATALNRMAEDLSSLYQSLEARVEERTRQVRTAGEVARTIVSTPSLEDLLRRAVELISEQFGYYHVSIFLLDKEGKFAELSEASSDIGQALKARRHKLEVNSQSVIGWVAANNQSRIVSEVSQDPAQFKNEFLPNTKSEAVVPLQVGGQVLGALDVQSTHMESFGPADVEILQTIADQLSAAIQNARLARASVTAADRARLVSEVTSELSTLMEVDEVLQTAAQALHKALGQPEILIKLNAPGSEPKP